MATCDYCNQTYRGWAIKDGHYRYCTGPCHERGRKLLNVLDKFPESQIEKTIISAHQSQCDFCKKDSGLDVYSSQALSRAVIDCFLETDVLAASVKIEGAKRSGRIG